MPSDKDRKTLQQQVLTATAYFLHIIGAAAMLYQQANYWKQPYHTSALTGQAWVNKLINGHPDRIFNELRMHLHVFLAFVANLRLICGLETSKHRVSVEEQAAIFLYACVTGLSIRHLGERFQRSNDTISKYFQKVLNAVSSGPFYDLYVKLPDLSTPIPDYILTNSKFFPYFRSVLGALDGTHINAFTSAADQHASHDHKGGITQNFLAACSFDFHFLYIINGFEGSAADATMYLHAHLLDFAIPQGKYYIADAGFAICDTLLVPYHGVHYHLAEWGQAGVRPANKEELYNLCHAQAPNVVECIFGVLKKRWDILNRPPQYDLSIQAKIPAGLGSVHNFIMDHNETDLEHYLDQEPTPENNTSTGALGDGLISHVERARATALRDEIATQMRNDYQQFLCEHPEVLEENFIPENE
ncbi:unnamed protein product [Cyclocybe aegerita]|uniref:DDE Tnp4 domain-containing protein n=1 Tax=Cyclocybe aegerita TaxID=1973307 RepID=A0A8S0XT68_CYCAE|nr:unnamed protein product [Cyclocybe aegerita]